MKTLENLYYGNIEPCELEGLRNRMDYHESTERALKARDTLEQMLTDEQKEAFGDFVTEWDKMCSIVEEEIFKSGFKIGMGIMMEVQSA